MIARDERWFSGVRDAAELPILTTRVLCKIVPLSYLGIDALSFGFRLALVDSESAVQIELARRARGLRLSQSEEEIALALAIQRDDIEEMLLGHSIHESNSSWTERLWLYVIVSAICRRREQINFPEAILDSVGVAWGEETSFDFARLKVRGFDRVFFGAHARNRYFTKLENALIAERDHLFPTE